MTTLAEVLRADTALGDAEVEWLHLLIGDWQLLSDLSFADLVLWVPGAKGGWRAVAHVRPNTGPMVFYDDIVGRGSSQGRTAVLDEAYRTRRIVAKPAPTMREDMAIREEAIPVVRSGEAIAVVTRHTNLTGGRTPSRLELTYRRLADALAAMIAAGDLPSTSAPTGTRRGAPRVGDGVLHLDVDGVVRYASPTAISAIHRLGHVGNVVGEVLAQVVADRAAISGNPVDESLAVVATGRAAWRSEVETRSATVTMRAIPLLVAGTRDGAMILVRDVSELRRREQELMTKDATIREIHHRVKNNLQTVAALLRLQARRIDAPEARAALDEAVRRVGAIAVVHETLAHTPGERVDADEVADRLDALVRDMSLGVRVSVRREGSFGILPAEIVTPLSMALGELLQNAVEHGAGSDVVLLPSRTPGELVVDVLDGGPGIPADVDPFATGRLGLQIVRTLVTEELGGRLELLPGDLGTGTRARIVVPLRDRSG